MQLYSYRFGYLLTRFFISLIQAQRHWLVVKNHLEKYEFVNEKDDIPYMKWKITIMFQSTNQIQYHQSLHLSKLPTI